MNRLPDVEVIFNFNGYRKHPEYDGYRPSHELGSGVLTTGIHHYYGTDSVKPNGSAIGTITFISPECYPHSLYVGQEINILEGGRITGVAKIISIINKELDKDAAC